MEVCQDSEATGNNDRGFGRRPRPEGWDDYRLRYRYWLNIPRVRINVTAVMIAALNAQENLTILRPGRWGLYCPCLGNGALGYCLIIARPLH